MKTMLRSLLALAVMASIASATDLGLKWNPNPAEDNVTRYEVTYHTGPDTEPVVVNVLAPDVRVTLTGLTPGVTYYFVVRAANVDGISEPSDVLVHRIPKPPAKPTGVELVVMVEDSTDNLTNWKPIAYIPLITKDPNRFLRTSVIEIQR